MSTIIIDNPFEGDDVCAACLQIQLTWFRNEIKEQWNAANTDGKTAEHTVHFAFKLNPNMVWQLPCTLVNGSLLCLTHYFNNINAQIEQQQAMNDAAKNGGRRGLIVPDGVIPPGFGKNN